jgi:hypothetical protein
MQFAQPRPETLRRVARGWPARIKRLVLGDQQTIAGTVYGSIVVMAVLVDAAGSYKHTLWRLDALVAISVVVLWLGHVYAHALGESLRVSRRLTLAELRSVARREYSMVLAAVAPLAVVSLGAAGLLASSHAIWLALAIGIFTLEVQGVRYVRLERLRLTQALVAVVINALIAFAFVTAKVLISH